MRVIAIVGNKGGAGKTTLSLNIANGLNRKFKTAIIDADPQGSSLQWRSFGSDDSADVYEITDDLRGQINELEQEYDAVIIDCPPSVHAEQTNLALEISDHALIPVQPSPVDLWATVHIEQAVERARETNPQLKPLLIINQLEPRTMLSKIVREAVNEIGLPVANAVIRRRAVFRSSALEGKSVYDVGRRGDAAVEELEQLIQEFMQ
ncbi:MAG TPA: ParA family partition ATPase [Gammaproteobacteria bacterium]